MSNTTRPMRVRSLREGDMLDMTTAIAVLDRHGYGMSVSLVDRAAAESELAVVEGVDVEGSGAYVATTLLNIALPADAWVQGIPADVTRVEEAPQPGLVYYTGRITFASGGDLERVMTMRRGDEDHMQVQAWLAGDVDAREMAEFVVAFDSVDLVEDPAVDVHVFETFESPAWEVTL